MCVSASVVARTGGMAFIQVPFGGGRGVDSTWTVVPCALARLPLRYPLIGEICHQPLSEYLSYPSILSYIIMLYHAPLSDSGKIVPNTGLNVD
jgi:hypothetical protein